MKNRGLVITIAFAVLVIIGMILYTNIVKTEPESFAILMTSDLQSQIAPFEMKVDDKKVEVGGIARIAAAADSVAETVDHYMLLSSGDDLMAPIYNVFGGGAGDGMYDYGGLYRILPWQP